MIDNIPNSSVALSSPFYLLLAQLSTFTLYQIKTKEEKRKEGDNNRIGFVEIGD